MPIPAIEELRPGLYTLSLSKTDIFNREETFQLRNIDYLPYKLTLQCPETIEGPLMVSLSQSRWLDSQPLWVWIMQCGNVKQLNTNYELSNPIWGPVCCSMNNGFDVWIDFGTKTVGELACWTLWANMLTQQEKTDVLFLIEGEVISAHRVVLSSSSEVFATLISSHIGDDPIPISGVNVRLFQAILFFIYTGDVLEEDKASLFAIADKFGLKEMKEILARLVLNDLTEQNAISTLLWAQQNALENLYDRVICYVASNYSVISAQPLWQDLVNNHPGIYLRVSELTVKSPTQGGALRPPPRKAAGGEGTLGRPIQISANHFAVTMKKQIIYHYDVDVKPLPPKKLFNKVVTQFLEGDARFNGIFPVFDLKKNIYTARRIPGLDSKVEIKFEFQEMDRETPRLNEFTIYLQPTGELEIDLSALASYCQGGSSVDIPLRPIQALDIALKYGAAQHSTKVMLGSCLLSKPVGKSEDLGGGVEVWFGHFQSLRLGWKPFLNVDATQRAFLKSGKVHEIMADMYGVRPGEKLDDSDYNDFDTDIAKLKVSYNRGKYIATVRCNGIKGSASFEKFECEGEMVTVQQYFENKLKTKLQYPHLPCVWVGSREKKILVPMELCSIAEGQEYRRKLSDFQTSAMIKVSATPADVRKKKILDSVRGMQFDKDPHAQHFGISVDSQMTKIQGRVLPTPKLVYGDKESSSIVPTDGVWNMKNIKFIEAKSMNSFGLINMTKCADREIDVFMCSLTKAGREMGMSMGQLLFNRPCQMRDLEKTMIMAKQKFPQLQIIFVIINRKGDPAYEIVKRVGDLDLKITTQCIQQKNVQGKNGPDPSTIANICLKLNAKLGGINNLISRDFRPKMLLQEQVIIMGADVTHPGADQQDSGKPSIAAVVGSVDPRASQYCCEIRIQKSKQEYIEDMENMVYNLLRKFNRVSGGTSTGKPQRIIFYRDGVSEGQFAKVLEWELSAIRKACMKLEVGYNPPVTFIVVQKRHRTRLFPEEQKDECGRGKNVPPGTIVDNTIVHPVEQDFFLVSHQGIQGTSRPTHYHVLWDDSKFPANDIQMLTYYMCYLFTRCTRSVSYPAPCYYSHLVALRGRQYYDNLMRNRQVVASPSLQALIDSTRDLNFMFFV